MVLHRDSRREPRRWLFGDAKRDEAGGHADADSDGADNLAEFIADTNPTNPASWFAIVAVSNRPPLEVYFSSSSGRVYTLEFASNLVTDVWTNIPGQSLIPGPGGSTSLSNVNSSASSNTSYRVKVALP